MWKRNLTTIILLVLILCPVAGQRPLAEKVTLPDSELTNLYRIDEGVYRSEQPKKQDFAALEAYGIKEVLNLRKMHSDSRKAQSSSLKLHRLKTSAHSISIDELAQALTIICQRQGPIVIHCHHGADRTGAVVALYRIVFQGFSKEEAIDEMKNGGFGFHKIYKNLIRIIEEADIDQLRSELSCPDYPIATDGN